MASHSSPPSPLQHVMSFSEVDACLATLAIPWYQRRILTAKKHAYTKSIAVLKNTMQTEAYMTPIQ